MNFLLFQYSGPLASFGGIAVGEDRGTERHPTKSSIIGLILSALGIERDQEEKIKNISDNIRVAVKDYNVATKIADFHTGMFPQLSKKDKIYTRRDELLLDNKKIHTLITKKEYLCDALFVIAVYFKNDFCEFSLEEIKHAIEFPHFTLYLGRKPCVPALPLNPVLMKKETILESFNEYKVVIPSCSGERTLDWIKVSNEEFLNRYMNAGLPKDYYFEDPRLFGVSYEYSLQRRDDYLNVSKRQFLNRKEFFCQL